MQFRSSCEHGSHGRGHLEAIQPPRHARTARAQFASHHKEGGNFLYLDGHARFVEEAAMNKWAIDTNQPNVAYTTRVIRGTRANY